MAKTRATAKTPTIAIARVLRDLGLDQRVDFSVAGEYANRPGGYGRERIGTFVTLHNRKAHETVAEHADAIEAAAKADGGWSFNVSIRYGKYSGSVFCGIANFGERIRETAPVVDLKVPNVKDAELRAAAVAMVTEVPAAEVPAAEVPAAEVAPAAEVDPATLMGNRYVKQGNHYRNGYPEAFTMAATVLGIIRGYTDPWTDERHEAGVRFRIMDDSRDWTSYHTLSLADFLKYWASA